MPLPSGNPAKPRDSNALMHQNADNFECSDCGKSFSSCYKLILHRGKAHTGEKRLFPRKVYRKPSNGSKSDPNALRSEPHSEKRMPERRRAEKRPPQKFECEFCGKLFPASSSLRYHLNVHTGEKPFACPACPKRFSQKSNMKSHFLDMHSEKKFVCEKCGIGFGRETRLRDHLLTHVGERPFPCGECPKRFTLKEQLDKHYLLCHPQSKSDQRDNGSGKELAPSSSDVKGYRLRAADKHPNYYEGLQNSVESDEDEESDESRSSGDAEKDLSFQESDDEPSDLDNDLDERSGGRRQPARGGGVLYEERRYDHRADEIRANKANATNWVADEEPYGSYEPERERVLDSDSEDDDRKTTSQHRSSDDVQPASPATTFSSEPDEWSSSNAAGVSLKFVYDVEYQEPE